MRKLIYAFSAFVLLSVISCSSDNNSDNSSNTEEVLLKKVIATDISGTVTTNYHYSGNKIVKSISSAGIINEFYYTGNLITKTAFFESTSNTPNTEEFFEYDSQNRIIESKVFYHYSTSYALKHVFLHNTDGTISFESLTGDFNTQNNLIKKGKYFLNTIGEVVKVEHYDLNDNLIEKEVFLHDSKNSLFKNVVGFNKLFVVNSMGKWNNILSYGSYNSANTLSRGYEITYQYNSANYPSHMFWTYSDGDELEYELFYE